jgi:hypothetical protein
LHEVRDISGRAGSSFSKSFDKRRRQLAPWKIWPPERANFSLTARRRTLSEALRQSPIQPPHAEGQPERRRHRLFVTRNTEYHFRDTVCVAVRDRRSGNWLPSHLALHRKVSGRVRFHPNGIAIPDPGDPEIGEALYFGDDGRELVTSLLTSIERPAKVLVLAYPEASDFVEFDVG